MQPTPEGPVFAVGETIMSEPADRRPPFLLPLILLSMCGCISLWFAGNAVLADLQMELGLPSESLGFLSSAVQLGFIGGTLLFAILGVADRFPARRLYCVCAVAGALLNLLIYPLAAYLPALLLLRFLTGFMLAGIYPVGMKIAAGWYREGLTYVNCLGFLLSIVSIELCNYLFLSIDPTYVFLFLIPGPFLGLVALWPLLRRERVAPAVES
jgi:MFS family permease